MSRDELGGILIAETDETGGVSWVWVLRTGERIPRPLPRRDVGLALDQFRIAGAERSEIASWMAAAAG